MTNANYHVSYSIRKGIISNVWMETSHDAARFAETIVAATGNDATITYPDGAIARWYVDDMFAHPMVQWVRF